MTNQDGRGNPIDPERKWVGQSVLRNEDPRLLSGRGTFVDDIPIPNVHHAAILRSPYGHARIKRIDMSKALELDGVLSGLTGREVKERTNPFPVGTTEPVHYYCMAVDKVRYVGEPVAAIVARNRYLAEDALELIEVEYEPLPAVVDPEKALDEGAPILHENVGSNLAVHRLLTYGDPDSAFEDADRVFGDRFVFPRYTSMPLETYGIVTRYDQNTGELKVWSNFMGPFTLHPVTARALRIPENRLRFLIPSDIGGSFGIKSSIYPYITLLGLLAMDVDVPVKWIEDRREHLLASSTQTDRISYREVAVTNDGTVLGFRTKLFDNPGGYLRAPEPASVFRPTGNLVGPYRVKNLQIDAHVVMTNKCPTGPNRGYGCQHIYFEQERLMDRIAEELGIDPVEVRLRNLIQAEEMPYTTPSGGIYDSGDYPRAFQMAVDMFKYSEMRERQAAARREGRLFGIGIAVGVDPSVSNMGYLTVALDPEVRARPGYLPKSGAAESATVKMDPFGGVTIFMSTAPQGQGHETVVSQIAADELGVSPESIMVVDEFDTVKSTWSISSGTYSSRFASVGTSAIASAARLLRERIDQIAAHLLKVSVADIELKDGHFRVRNDPEREIKWKHVIGTAHWNPNALPDGMEVGLQVTKTFSFPRSAPPDPEDRVNSSNTYGFMTDICAVEVDPETGKVEIVKWVSFHDAGTIIHPKIVEGQVYGAAFHGIAGALYEEQVYDDQGQCLTASLVDYEAPYATEAPKLEIGHIESPSPLTTLGSKGAGEASSETAPACIAGAVGDALAPLGITVNELPLTPVKIWELLQQAKATVGRES